VQQSSEFSLECTLPVRHRVTAITFGQLDLDATLAEAQTAVLRQLLEVLVDVYDAAAVLVGKCAVMRSDSGTRCASASWVASTTITSAASAKVARRRAATPCSP